MGGDHVPACLQFITADKIKALAATVELETSAKPQRPAEFYEHAKRELSGE